MASSWYEATADAAKIPPHVAERALEWLLELQGDAVSPETVAAWTRWRAEHPDNERAWQRIESVKGRLKPLASPATADIARAALASSDDKPRRRAIKTLAVLVFTGGAAWSANQYSPWRQWAADYRTAIGERRALTLSDGTRLWLNTDSAVDIRFDDDVRRVKLVAGEILVETAKDSRSVPRPFVVETADGTAHARGTRYAVRQRDGDTEVSVYDGAVEIRPRRSAGQPLLLRAGHRASYTRDTVTAPVATQEAGATWAEGFIVARSMRLDDFIAELGRYSKDSLSCDPRLAAIRVSGSFPLDDVGKVLDALAATLDVRTEATTRLWGKRELRVVPQRGAASL